MLTNYTIGPSTTAGYYPTDFKSVSLTTRCQNYIYHSSNKNETMDVEDSLVRPSFNISQSRKRDHKSTNYFLLGIATLGIVGIIAGIFAFGVSDSSTSVPTSVPTSAPTVTPTSVPTSTPTVTPTSVPTSAPTVTPTGVPTSTPTVAPTRVQTGNTESPTTAPTATPTSVPTESPTESDHPTSVPTIAPTT